MGDSIPTAATESPAPRSPSLQGEENPFIARNAEVEALPPPFVGSNQFVFSDDKGRLARDNPAIIEESRIALPLSPISAGLPSLPTPQQCMNDADALDCAAQSLEEAAAHQTDRKVQKMLLRKAKKLRRKSSRMRGTNKHSPAKCILGGMVMVVTAPFFATGALIEGTGICLDASAMVLKGTGRGLKKIHTWTAEKMGF
ncbi:hypothetical protein BKA70DRAFT_1433426 [Coprinopsis sp. MPI-PUGE-AT-0042]|nr:hypothetical protein BKA70DRAFT_1433426 [Coprinopsis sp. MPI-PUGE-AT-0042]